MYNHYFGFREKPFSVNPDPRFFYTNPHYQEAYANLVYAIHEHRGFVVLTGEIGTGKTTLLRRLMDHLEPNIHVVFFANGISSFEDLLDVVCEELGLAVQGQGRLHKMQALNQGLIEQRAKDSTVVLLIDEAQVLGEEVLENLRLLSNLETSREKLLQIALVGQPELETTLDHPNLRQLKQRIASHYRLSRLSDEEVGPYIQYRLSAVGYTRQQLFAPEAVHAIARYAKGFPRLINILCDNALLMAYAASKKRVTAEIIRQVALDLRLVLPAEEARHDKSAEVAPTSPGTEPIRLRSNQGARLLRRGSLQHQTISLRILLPVLLLVLAGVGFYAWSPHRRVVASLNEGLGSWPHTVQKAIQGVTSEGGHSPVASDAVQQPSSAMGTGASTDEGGTPSATHSSPSNRRTESAQAPEHGRMAGQPSDARSEAGVAWQQEPMAIPVGSTLVDIAAKTYGAHRLLGLDLIKEFNPHIANLNRVVAGQKLWVPPLTRDTLVRQQPDGSYHLMVGAFQTRPQAEQVAQWARLKGYTTVISPRNLGNGLVVHRVEIRGLEGLRAVDDAWQTAFGSMDDLREPSRRRY
jgi:general secretion pathway protein A